MRHFLAVILVVVCFKSFGQIQHQINTIQGPVITNDISTIDSIRFNGSTQMEVIFNNGSNSNHNINDIINVTFSGTPIGTVNALNCSSNTDTLFAGDTVNGITAIIGYLNGNGGPYNGETVTSTGVTGLTAFLAPGNFNAGFGNIFYNITGVPNNIGIASFALSIGGQTCNLNYQVNENIVLGNFPLNTVFCGGNATAILDVINPTTGVIWMDRNLGASNVASSSNDAAALGDLYQWGRRADGHQCRNSSTTNILSSIDQPNNGFFILANFNSQYDWHFPQSDSLWQGSFGINNPCPYGYRPPTELELNNERLSWSNNSNLGAFNSPLKLTRAGFRYAGDGSLYYDGSYWTSTINAQNAKNLYFNSSGANLGNTDRGNGLSVRCLRDYTPSQGAIYSIECGLALNSGTLIKGNAANAVTSKIPFTGGNGAPHNGQIVASTGVLGLTATLPAGNFSVGIDSLIYTISGTPNSDGIAYFAINIGGKSCVLQRTVVLPQGIITSLDCANAIVNGNLFNDSLANGVSVALSYSGGNGGVLLTQNFYSYGVTGLTATLNIDTLENGAGTISLIISGTPTGYGLANFNLSISGQNCILAVIVNQKIGSVTSIECLSSSTNGIFMVNTPINNVAVNVPYSGGNGGTYTLQNIASTNVTGLTATLIAGTLAIGPGLLTYSINGTPSNVGDAKFLIQIGNKTCTLTVHVLIQGAIGTFPAGYINCNGMPTQVVDIINPISGRIWMDRNLGASQMATSSTDNAAYGDLYQWGRGADGHQCRNSDTTTVLSTTYIPGHGKFIAQGYWFNPSLTIIDLWQGLNGVNNPCPIGYRVPTKFELYTEVISADIDNINAEGAFNVLKFTKAGFRNSQIIAVTDIFGYYQSSTVFNPQNHQITGLIINANSAGGGAIGTGQGSSVRCIKDVPTSAGSIAAIDCINTSNFGELVIGMPAVDVKSVIFYETAGVGFYNGQTINSTGVTGLTATILDGTFSLPQNSFIIYINGTPNSYGQASFTFNIGGQTCTLTRTVLQTPHVTSFNSNLINVSGSLTSCTTAVNVSVLLPYTGGNGGVVEPQDFSSTGVPGLSANLQSGILAMGGGNILFTITGVPLSAGLATFSFNIGGHNGQFSISVGGINGCGLYDSSTVHCNNNITEVNEVINPVTGKIWMDRNLGATQEALNGLDTNAFGDLYQWGRRADGHQCRNSTITSALSSTPVPNHDDFILSSSFPNSWFTPFNYNLWLGSSGSNNPCPLNYRLPTQAEMQTEVSSWLNQGPLNSPLKLTYAGVRSYSNGLIYSTGTNGYYWTGEGGASQGKALGFNSVNNNSSISNIGAAHGSSVRCIKGELPTNTTIGALNCNDAVQTGTLTEGIQIINPNIFNINYSQGSGGLFNTMSFQSTGVNGITATIYSDTLALGSGNLDIQITGIPATSGVATFEINFLGHTCTVNLQVFASSNVIGTYRAQDVFCNGTPTAVVDVVDPITGYIWMDRNLGASQAAVNELDPNSFGDLYQWGRRSDGHQCRNSSVTNVLSSQVEPNHGNFIITETAPPYNWTTYSYISTWNPGSIFNSNNPCPIGYRIPTKPEWQQFDNSLTSVSPYMTFLKLPLAGSRIGLNGTITEIGVNGSYWSTYSQISDYTATFDINNSFNTGVYDKRKIDGRSVRCIKD